MSELSLRLFLGATLSWRSPLGISIRLDILYGTFRNLFEDGRCLMKSKVSSPPPFRSDGRACSPISEGCPYLKRGMAAGPVGPHQHGTRPGCPRSQYADEFDFMTCMWCSCLSDLASQDRQRYLVFLCWEGAVEDIKNGSALLF
jgi:hypothetical protein